MLLRLTQWATAAISALIQILCLALFGATICTDNVAIVAFLAQIYSKHQQSGEYHRTQRGIICSPQLFHQHAFANEIALSIMIAIFVLNSSDSKKSSTNKSTKRNACTEDSIST
jgi:hypothetical protein